MKNKVKDLEEVAYASGGWGMVFITGLIFITISQLCLFTKSNFGKSGIDGLITMNIIGFIFLYFGVIKFRLLLKEIKNSK